MPQVESVLAQFHHHSCVKVNSLEQAKMIDSGLLKAMLDILASEALSSKTLHDKSAIMLLQILNANSDIYSTLYCYRTLAAICKSNKNICHKFSGEILQTLTKSLGLRLGGNSAESLA